MWIRCRLRSEVRTRAVALSYLTFAYSERLSNVRASQKARTPDTLLITMVDEEAVAILRPWK